MSLVDETRAILGDLISYPTVSADGNLTLIAYAVDRLSSLGASIALMRDASDQKASLFATLGPPIDGGIVLSGHTDVVPAEEEEWRTDPFVMGERDGLLYGRGTCDMKGFIAAALAVAPRYAALDLKRPVHFAFTYDEEVGCLGGQQLVTELASMEIRPSAAIIGEPTEMRIIEGHKGCYEYTTTFTGLEGHGSLPDAGINAVEYAVRYISRLMQLGEELKKMAPDGSPFDPPWTTVQVGRIEGGSVRNVIAGQCAFDWEMRPVRVSDADHVKSVLRTYCEHTLLPAMRAASPSATIETHVIAEVQGLEPVPDNEARGIVAELTGDRGTDVVSFGTEAGLFQALGMSAVVCGPGSIAQAHKPNEYVSIGQLEACLAMLTGLERQLTVAP